MLRSAKCRISDATPPYVKHFGTLSLSKHGTADLQFRYPRGLIINQTNGDIYVCDRDNRRI